jgi:hypothetical protein
MSISAATRVGSDPAYPSRDAERKDWHARILYPPKASHGHFNADVIALVSRNLTAVSQGYPL